MPCCSASSCVPPNGLPAAWSSYVTRIERSSPVTTPTITPDSRLNMTAWSWIWLFASCAAKRIAGSLELVRDQDREEQPCHHSDDHTGQPVEHDRLELDLAVRELCGAIDDDDDREKDPEETVDARVGGPVSRRLLQDKTGLQTHV